MIGNESPYLIYLIAGGLSLLIGLIAALAYFLVQRNSSQTAYDKQLEELLNQGITPPTPSITLAMRWNGYWDERIKVLNISRYSTHKESSGRDVLVLGILLAVVLSISLANPFAGIIISALALYVIAVLLKGKANRASELINSQLPGFLFALKANIQANETPERAILKVVDNMPSPLYEDLIMVKQRILANASFKEALQELAKTTTSRDLRFLCACMIQASATGANLEKQITVIQEVLFARSKVTDELAKAVRSASPAIWVASFIIPAVFIGTLFIDPNAKLFWFKQPISWAGLATVALLYTFGVWMSKKLVDNIKNL